MTVMEQKDQHQQLQITWSSNSDKHLDHIPCLPQSMDIDDFGTDFWHNGNL